MHIRIVIQARTLWKLFGPFITTTGVSKLWRDSIFYADNSDIFCNDNLFVYFVISP